MSSLSLSPHRMRSPQQHQITPLPIGTEVVAGTLRAHIEALRARGARAGLREAISIVVPLSVQLAELHRAGHLLFVHPSSLLEDGYGSFEMSSELARVPPALPRDKACLAPEERSGKPGGARASVFSLGAILYELLTGKPVGPAMQRPTEINSTLPAQLEQILMKALVSDPVHRPDDLLALAQALHQLAPPGTVPPPPPADTTHLDQDENFEVDVSLSLFPPASTEPGPAVPRAPMRDATLELTSLKARLESDSRPRYLVIRAGMDHGPFQAVELLQQIASHQFVESDAIRDLLSKDERPIRDWEEFAPFAEHAKLHRDIRAERAEIERVVIRESRSTRSKALLGVIVVGGLLVVGGIWFLTARGTTSDQLQVQGDTASNVELEGGLLGKSRRTAGPRARGKSGGFPALAGGMSCEAARASYVEEMSIGGPRGQADITGGQYGSILNRGSYFSHCGVPESTGLDICAAVQNGRAVGVTVLAQPRNRTIESCVGSAVRRLGFPSNPKLDVTRTQF